MSEEQVQMKVRITPSLRERVKAKAEESGQSVNEAIIQLLTEWVAGTEQVQIPLPLEPYEPYAPPVKPRLSAEEKRKRWAESGYPAEGEGPRNLKETMDVLNGIE